MKIVKSLKKVGLFIKGASETIKHEIIKKGEFLNMLFGTLGTSLFVNLITIKGVKQSKTLDCVAKDLIVCEVTYLDEK